MFNPVIGPQVLPLSPSAQPSTAATPPPGTETGHVNNGVPLTGQAAVNPTRQNAASNAPRAAVKPPDEKHQPGKQENPNNKKEIEDHDDIAQRETEQLRAYDQQVQAREHARHAFITGANERSHASADTNKTETTSNSNNTPPSNAQTQNSINSVLLTKQPHHASEQKLAQSPYTENTSHPDNDNNNDSDHPKRAQIDTYV